MLVARSFLFYRPDLQGWGMPALNGEAGGLLVVAAFGFVRLNRV